MSRAQGNIIIGLLSILVGIALRDTVPESSELSVSDTLIMVGGFMAQLCGAALLVSSAFSREQ